MKIFFFTSFLVCLISIIFPNQSFADNALDVYMNDFYSKSNAARQILKEIENNLKEGSRKKYALDKEKLQGWACWQINH